MIALLRRLRPDRISTARPLPLVWMDEDGEDYFGEGHIEPHRMVLAAIADHLLDVGSEETCELIFGVDLLLARGGRRAARGYLADRIAAVEHVWAHVDPDDDGRFVYCTASHPCARPFTRMRCF